jgi:hypothetical protein
MLRIFFRAILQPFSAHQALAAAVFGCFAGVVLALSFRFFANGEAMRALRRKLWAHVLELRLFGDEPSLAFRGLFRIVKINALLVGHALPPLAITAPVVGLLLVHLNDFFTPTLPIGGAAVLTVRLRSSLPSAASIHLLTPPWIDVDAPPVHIPAAREVSWRLRAQAPNLAVCTISIPGETVTKELDSRSAPRYSGRVRTRPWLDVLLHPAEARLPDGPIDRIWISQVLPPLAGRVAGMDWEEWFAGTGSITAWLLAILLARRRRESAVLL